MRNAYGILVRWPEGKMEDNIEVNCGMVGCGLNSPGSVQGLVAGSCEQGNELPGSIKGRNIFTS
jgi:hypothetical protein